MTDVTTTIIVTSQYDNVLEQVDFLRSWLSENTLKKFTITSQTPIQLIVLRNFQRILIVSPTLEISQQIMSVAMPRSLCMSYAPSNTVSSIQHLEVPKSERMFLISPPTSPPPGFDYSRCEEPPPEPQPTHTYKHTYQSDVPVTILNSRVANITVHPCREDRSVESGMDQYQRTAMPPKSIFDEESDEE